MAKLGIDARFCTDKATGIGKHVYELIQHLAKLDQKNEYVIFLNPEVYPTFNIPHSRFQKKLSTAKHYSPAEQTTFLRQINQENFDLMIFPHFNAPIFYKRPFVVTIHDLTLHKYPGKKKTGFLSRAAYKHTIKTITRKATHCFAVSENTKKDMIDLLNLDPDKITVTLNGVSQRFKPLKDIDQIRNTQKRYHLPSDYFLYTGVMRSHKNVLGMIEAYKQFLAGARLQGLHKIPSFVIAGPQDKVYFKEILERCKTLQIPIDKEPGVFFPGFLEEEDINAIMVGSRAFIYTTFYEGFGIPPLEAMQCGVPTIVSNTSSLPEVCGDASLYCNPHNTHDIAEAMNHIHSDGSLRTKIKTKGLMQCQKFSWEAMTQKMLDTYNHILDGND